MGIMSDRSTMYALVILFIVSSAMANNLQGTKLSCGSINWNQVTCRTSDAKKEKEDYINQVSHTEKLVDWYAFVGTITTQLGSINQPQNACYGSANNLAELRKYTHKLVKKKPLSNCQKACVVKCVTSNYLKYDSQEHGATKMSACQAANKGKGDCKAFSNLADHLLDSLGVPSRSVASATHAFNKVKLNGKWFIMEPQQSDCRFMYK